jgi:hypothetical protein
MVPFLHKRKGLSRRLNLITADAVALAQERLSVGRYILYSTL